MHLALGSRLGPYEILSSIGAGGMGEVYKARDTRLDRIVAIKVSREQFEERFAREARAVAALSHPHICTLFDIGSSYLVMEYVDGQPLRGPLPVRQVLEYASQICDALQAAHAKAIVHRDLKPGNVLVTSEGIKLLDFGLAKVQSRVSVASETEEMPITCPGEVLGTLQYMAPEQMAGQEADERSDLFSVGAILYELVTGRRAFQGDSAMVIAAAVMHEEPPKPRDFAADLPMTLERIILRCLKKNADARYCSATELAQDLKKCRAELEAESSSGINLKVLLRRSRRPHVAIPLAVLVIALCGLSAMLAQRLLKVPWAHNAVARAAVLAELDQLGEAYALASEAERYIPGDGALTGLWPRIAWTTDIKTTPPGAKVYSRNYLDPNGNWELRGVTPLKRRMPLVNLQWKLEKLGHDPVERASIYAFGRMRPNRFDVVLDEHGKAPAGMIRVDGSLPTVLRFPGYEDLPAISLGDYWIDKHE